MAVASGSPSPVELTVTLTAKIDPEKFGEVDVAQLVPAVAQALAAHDAVDHLTVSATLTGGAVMGPAYPESEA